jgi:hypothetical protein
MRFVTLFVLAACADPATTGTRQQALATACGPGTHAANGECVLDRYEVRAARLLGADGVTRNKVVVFGWEPNGAPALDEIVLSLDRMNGGALTRTKLKLEQLGATTYFTGCDENNGGCVKGPLEIRVALASDPTTIVGKLAVEVVDPINANPAKPCLGGGGQLRIEGNDPMLNGNVNISTATWAFPQGAYQNELFMTVTPIGSTETWTLQFNTAAIPGNLLPRKVYEEVSRAELDHRDQARDMPAMYIRRTGYDCASIKGMFQVLDHEIDYSNGARVKNATVYFEQHCNGDTSTVLRGCVHFQ